MTVAVDHQRPPSFGEHFAANQAGRVRVALPENVAVIVDVLDGAPIHRWIAEQDAQLTFARQRTIQIAYRLEELVEHRSIPGRCRSDRVLSDVAKRRWRQRLTAHEAVHHVLIRRAAALDDDVVHQRGKPRIANQRQAKRVSQHVTVRALTQRDDRVRRERVENGRGRIQTNGWPAPGLLRAAIHPCHAEQRSHEHQAPRPCIHGRKVIKITHRGQAAGGPSISTLLPPS